MKLLLNIASRKRKIQLDELMFNIMSTLSQQHQCLAIIKLDIDDDSYGYPGLVAPFTKPYLNIEVIRCDHVNKIYATNICVSDYDWDIVLNVSDDMRFSKNSWDDIMIEKIRSVWPTSTDFYPAFNDGYVGHKLATLDIKGREYYERDGYIYHPSYKSVSCDAENLYVAMMRGRHHYFPEVLFKHLHPANTKATKNDETYQLNHKYDKEDTDNYFKRLADNFYVDGDLKAARHWVDNFKPHKERWPV